MRKIYTTCLWLGFIFAVIHLLFHFLGEITGAVLEIFDLDFFDIDIGDFEICLLPLSFNSIGGGLIIFGGAGILLGQFLPKTPTLVAAVVCGYITAVLIQSLIRRLKKFSAESNTFDTDLLTDCKATVISRIPAEGFGVISVKVQDYGILQYPAKSSGGKDIYADTVVNIDHFIDGVAYVHDDKEIYLQLKE
ncbi:MAG: hypothetical protein Q4D16_02390 [Eubacteriales bacterium]|nr:hypothetical protein [Eubacteriales bacterium]